MVYNLTKTSLILINSGCMSQKLGWRYIFTQCWFNVGPTSQMVGQRWTSIGWICMANPIWYVCYIKVRPVHYQIIISRRTEPTRSRSACWDMQLLDDGPGLGRRWTSALCRLLGCSILCIEILTRFAEVLGRAPGGVVKAAAWKIGDRGLVPALAL